jgi:hypothetical protein
MAFEHRGLAAKTHGIDEHEDVGRREAIAFLQNIAGGA